jgi:predicted DNA-binding WGR domain protein
MATLVNIDPAKNMHRFYSVRILPTLFGEWSIMREWGRIGSPGRFVVESFGSEDEAREEERRTIRTRARHGYHQVDL